MVGLAKGSVQALATLLFGMLAGLISVVGGTKSLALVPALAGLSVFFMIPMSGFYVIAATTPINVEIAGPLTVSRLAIVIGFLALMFQSAKGQVPRLRLMYGPAGIAGTVFFLWVLVATIGAGGGGLVGRLGAWIIYAVIFFVTLNYVNSRRMVHSIFILLAVAGFVQAVFVIVQVKTGFSPFGGWHAELQGFFEEGEVRAAGTSAHPIFLGAYFQLVLGSLFYLFFAGTKNTLVRILILAAVGVCLAGWWYTFARSSWIGMSVMVYVALLLSTPAIRRMAIVGGVFVFCILASFNFSPGAVIDYIESLATFSAVSSTGGLADGSQSLTWRRENWQAAFSIFQKHWLFGAGLDASQNLMLSHLNPGAWAHRYIKPEVPHNIFLFLLAELGIVSFFLFCVLLSMAMLSLWRALATPEYRVIGIALTSIMFGQYATFMFNPPPREIWLMLAWVLALGRVMLETGAVVPLNRQPVFGRLNNRTSALAKPAISGTGTPVSGQA